jgi:DNA gyrase inhibitor GyrI
VDHVWKTDIRELTDIPVLCVKAAGGLNGIKEAWERVEEPLESLQGRKFYGTYLYEAEDYRACFRARSDDPEFEGLERWVIPGGRYARRKLTDWREDTSQIGKAFDEMTHYFGEEGDAERPSIEFYRSQNEVILYFPIG